MHRNYLSTPGFKTPILSKDLKGGSIHYKHRVIRVSNQGGSSGKRGSFRGMRLLEWTNGILPQSTLVTTAKFAWNTTWLTFMRELAPQSDKGSYDRPEYSFQNRIGDGTFPFESGRYAVYLGGPCPWCHRVRLALALRGLEDDFLVVKALDDPEKASRGGWIFDGTDPVFGCKDLREVYDMCVPGGYRGRCTAPLLVDTKKRKIVCNESSIIVENLNDITSLSSSDIDLRPKQLLSEIERWNNRLYNSVNNGVYRCGFATSQRAYDDAQRDVFDALEEMDRVLEHRRFLCGDKFTEADLRLFPTSVRFDPVYAILFKCSRKRWKDFDNLQRWLRDCCQLPIPSRNETLLDTVDIEDCRRSYFTSLFPLNPGGIVPSGPTVAELHLGDSVPGGRELVDLFYMRSN